MNNQKERIMDLMRKGIITELEAIELLEKSGLSTDDKTSEDGQGSANQTDKEGYQTDSSEAIKQFVNQAGSFMKTMFHSAKKSVDNNVDFSNGFPSLKHVTKSDFKAFEDQITALSLSATSGDVTVVAKDVQKTIVEISYKVYGGISEDVLDDFIRENVTIELDQGELVVAVKSKRIVVDLTITMAPNKLQSAKFDVVNGSMALEDLVIADLNIKKVNGDVSIKNGRTDSLTIKSVNGEIKVATEFETADINSVNGEVIITESAIDGESLKVKNVNGDIKISVPKNIGLVGYVKTTFGKYKTRIDLDSPLEITKNGAALVRTAVNSLTLDIATNTGSIWLKDGETVMQEETTDVSDEQASSATVDVAPQEITQSDLPAATTISASHLDESEADKHVE